MDACTAVPAEVRAQEFGNVQSFDRTIRPMRGVQVHPAPMTDTCGADSAQQTLGVPGAFPGPLEKLIEADGGRDPSSSETDRFGSSTSVSLATLAPASRGCASPRPSRRALMEPPNAFGSEKFIFDGGLPPIQKSGFTAAPVSKLDSLGWGEMAKNKSSKPTSDAQPAIVSQQHQRKLEDEPVPHVKADTQPHKQVFQPDGNVKVADPDDASAPAPADSKTPSTLKTQELDTDLEAGAQTSEAAGRDKKAIQACRTSASVSTPSVAKKGRRASVADLIEFSASAAASVAAATAASASTVGAMVKKAGRRVSVAMGLDSAISLRVMVHDIRDFPEYSGFMDKTDPYVQLQLGAESYKTKYKNNVGGNATFNESFTFSKQASDNIMTITVWDKDTLSDDLLGERQIDLRLFDLNCGVRDPATIEVFRQDINVGRVRLSFTSGIQGKKMAHKSRNRAVGSEAQALLSLVPGGDGEGISREQYVQLLKQELKRLKLASLDKNVVEGIVYAVFGEMDRLDMNAFELLLNRLQVPVGKISREKPDQIRSRHRSGGLTREESMQFRAEEYRTLLGRLKKATKKTLAKCFDDNGYRLWCGIYVATNMVVGFSVYTSRKGWFNADHKRVVGACGGELVNMARVFGMLLNLNCVLVLIPMFRAIFTLMQGTWLTNYIPFEKAYDAHLVLGSITFVLSLAHALFHVLNLILWEGWSLNGSLWCGKDQDGFLFCSAVSGIVLQIIFCVMIAFSLPYFRRSKRFNMFWTMHHLVIGFYVVLLMHGRVFWKWFLPVILTYGLDRLLRRRSASFSADVLMTEAKGEGVIQIRFQKPRWLKYEAGQYVFLKSRVITKYEWHPFTLTSCPEDDFLECHIKSVGDWTSALHEHYDANSIVDGVPAFSLSTHALQVDGPHGAPSQDWAQYESAVLVSAGIGVTPFAAIIKHMSVRMQMVHALQDAGLRVPPTIDMYLKKVYFIWICRSREALSWFTDIISETKQQLGDKFEIHVYLSSVTAMGDVTAGLTHVGLKAYFEHHKRDAITGLNTITNYDKPRWGNVFCKLQHHHANERVGVFFCGPPSLAETLRKECAAGIRNHCRHVPCSIYSLGEMRGSKVPI